MKRRVQRPCAVCGRPCWGQRCRACYAAQTVARPRRHDLGNDWSERQRRARAVAAHREAYGDVCPGWNRPPHPSLRLAADHILEVHRGGDPRGELQVLCQSCNSRKSNAVRSGRIRITGSRQW